MKPLRNEFGQAVNCVQNSRESEPLVPSQFSHSCDVLVVSRGFGILLAVTLIAGIIGSPLILGYAASSVLGLLLDAPFANALVTVMAGIIGCALFLWAVSRYARQHLWDRLTLEETQLVFTNRSSIHFSDIVTYNADKKLKLGLREQKDLVIWTVNPVFRSFCRAFADKIQQWSAAHPHQQPPVQKYFYGTLLAQATGLALLTLFVATLAITFMLGTGTAPAIAICAPGIAIALTLASGRRRNENTSSDTA